MTESTKPVPPDQELLKSGDVAARLGVGVSTVKRWADAGLLETVVTPGGHRRFRLSDVLTFQAQGVALRPTRDWERAWVYRLLGARSHFEIDASLLGERAKYGSWHELADDLGGVLEAIGQMWAEGEITVSQEHQASEVLARALARVADGMVVPQQAPTCVLATAEGDDHTLGLSLADVCAREQGYHTRWLGGRMPTELICEHLRSQGSPRVLAMSASIHSGDEHNLRNQVTRLLACSGGETALILGGRGAWPQTEQLCVPPGRCYRVRTLAELAALLGRLARS